MDRRDILNRLASLGALAALSGRAGTAGVARADEWNPSQIPHLRLGHDGLGLQISDVSMPAPKCGHIRLCQGGGQQVGWPQIDAFGRGVASYNPTVIARLDAYAEFCRKRGIKMIYCFDGTPAYCALNGDIRNRASSPEPLFIFLEWLTGRYYASNGAFPGALECIDPWNEPNTPGSFTGTYRDGPTNDLVVHAGHIRYYLDQYHKDRLTARNKLFVSTPSFTEIYGVVPMRNYLANGGAELADIFAFHAYRGGGDNEPLYYDPYAARQYVLLAGQMMPQADIWMTECGDSAPNEQKMIDMCADLKSLGVSQITVYAWDEKGVGDMAVKRALGLALWNRLYTALVE